MQLTLTTKHAIRSLLYLCEYGAEPCSVRVIHEAAGIPRKYLGRVMCRLCDAGLVTATRGKKGGYRLARESATITLREVVDAIQGLESFQRCMLGLETCAVAVKGPCVLHEPWQAHREGILETLTTVTLADLTGAAPCRWETLLGDRPEDPTHAAPPSRLDTPEETP